MLVGRSLLAFRSTIGESDVARNPSRDLSHDLSHVLPLFSFVIPRYNFLNGPKLNIFGNKILFLRRFGQRLREWDGDL